jgi:glycosyltransferase involved in cell wall biosynthesis
MNILIYFPYNLRSVEQQSVMEMLVKQTHSVFLLTTCERGYLHDFVEEFGVKSDAVTLRQPSSKFQLYSGNYKKLAAFIGNHNIDVVIAHQQFPALIAGLLRTRKKFVLVYVRHNSDEDYQLTPFKAKWMNKIVNWLTPIKVAPSTVVKNFWREKEGVPSAQIHRINYGYNFKQYELPVPVKAEQIIKDFPAQLRILSIARLTSTKRHSMMFSVIKRLVDTGIDCKLICLGSGALTNELNELIKFLHLQDHIFLIGRKENVFDYISAADVFLHLSSSEASNSAVKEVGLCKRPVIVCKGVGDFEDYIRSGENGFLVDKEHPAEEAFGILNAIAEGKINGNVIGRNLFETVTTTFDIQNVADQYEALLHQTMKAK